MLFRSASIFLVSVFSAQGVIAALTPGQVVGSIKALTSASQDVNDALAPLSTSTTITEVRTSSKKLVSGFTTIVETIVTDVAVIKVTPAFPADAGDAIVEALTDFVLVHQLLLSTVIGRHSIFAQFGLTAPIAAVLRLVEAQVDALAFGLISLIPANKDSVQRSQKTLDTSLANSVSTYSEFCIPNPFYPAKLPKCVAL